MSGASRASLVCRSWSRCMLWQGLRLVGRNPGNSRVWWLTLVEQVFVGREGGTSRSQRKISRPVGEMAGGSKVSGARGYGGRPLTLERLGDDRMILVVRAQWGQKWVLANSGIRQAGTKRAQSQGKAAARTGIRLDWARANRGRDWRHAGWEVTGWAFDRGGCRPAV